MTCLSFVVLALLGQASSLDQLEVRYKAALAENDYQKKAVICDEVRDGVLALITDDKLKTGTDLARVAPWVAPNIDRFPYVQIGYELRLAALAAGDADAAKDLGSAWDQLLVGLDRGRRIGAVKIPVSPGAERYRLSLTARVICDVYKNPTRAREVAANSKANPEIQALVDADQKARESDFSKLSPKEIDGLVSGDRKRLNRVKAIVRAGALRTSADFANAALVCQHGAVFEDYALAHELSVASVILGGKSAWLAGASYDRMLNDVGLPQRFATQYTSNGSGFKLDRVDTFGINDTMRKFVVRKTLEEARNVSFV